MTDTIKYVIIQLNSRLSCVEFVTKENLAIIKYQQIIKDLRHNIPSDVYQSSYAFREMLIMSDVCLKNLIT